MNPNSNPNFQEFMQPVIDDDSPLHLYDFQTELIEAIVRAPKPVHIRMYRRRDGDDTVSVALALWQHYVNRKAESNGR